MVFKEVDCWLVLMSLVNYSLLLDYSLLKGIVGFSPNENSRYVIPPVFLLYLNFFNDNGSLPGSLF